MDFTKNLKEERIKNLLKNIWLENNESKVYLEFLKSWTNWVTNIANKIWLPRTTTRFACDSLVRKWFLILSKKWNTQFFTAENPSKIKILLQVQKNELEENEEELENLMPEIVKLKNPFTNFPKFSFYEWIDWIKKVLEDSLSSKETIDTYVDIDSLIENLSEIDAEYMDKREELWIKKRAILSDSWKTKKYVKTEIEEHNLNEIKYLDTEKYDMHLSFMIYDWKISYITMENWSFVWVIIKDRSIYEFHKNIFQFNWDKL